MHLEGKVALVTGGGTGIGASIARRLVADGAKVCIAGRRAEPLDEVAGSLPAGMTAVCQGDVSVEADGERMTEAALSLGGRLDILINNAGINPRGQVTDLDPEIWRKTLEVNVTGPFLLMRAAIPHMMKRGGGSVINISSLGGIRCMPAMPAYNTSKAALIMLTRQAALDYGPYGVRCNVVCPGAVKTPMMDGALRRFADEIGTDYEHVVGIAVSDVPLRRMADPSDICGVCSFLAGDDSAFMTGSVLVLDGGVHVVDAGRVALQRASRERQADKKGR